MKLGKMVTNVKSFGSKHALGITFGLGVGCLLAAVVVTAINAPKAAEAYEEKGQEQVDNDEDTNTVKAKAERVFAAGVYYIPTVILTGAGVYFTFKSKSIAGGGISAIETLYVAEKAKNMNLKKKVKEMFGDKKAEEVEHSINQDIIKARTMPAGYDPIAGSGDYICIEVDTGIVWMCNRVKIEQAIKVANEWLEEGKVPYISMEKLHELYRVPEPVQVNYEMYNVLKMIGWSNHNKVQKDVIEPIFDFGADSLGRPCMTITYADGPETLQDWGWE